MNIIETQLSEGTHVVILGAGASIAVTNQDPEIHGMKLPSMKDLPVVVGLNDILSRFPVRPVLQSSRSRVLGFVILQR